MLQLSTMKSTRFVEPFTKEVDYWERTLSYILETLEAALSVQRQWLYLEVIIVNAEKHILMFLNFTEYFFW
jgi:dynein heavy chain